LRPSPSSNTVALAVVAPPLPVTVSSTRLPPAESDTTAPTATDCPSATTAPERLRSTTVAPSAATVSASRLVLPSLVTFTASVRLYVPFRTGSSRVSTDAETVPSNVGFSSWSSSSSSAVGSVAFVCRTTRSTTK